MALTAARHRTNVVMSLQWCATMKSVSAREANQGFSKLLAEVAKGKEVVITRHGKPVARLVPIQDAAAAKKREAAIKRMMKRLEKGVPLGGLRATRDEMHER
jgi:prevent-host-death family protein